MNHPHLIQAINELLRELFPICRSITGDGVRKSIAIIRDYAPEFQLIEYPSGQQVYDWTIPKEWNINDAYIKDSEGNRIIDFRKSNLHVVSYSIPVYKKISFNELKSHLYTIPKLPDAIPYRTSYYKESWGFCLTQNQFDAMNRNGEYEVFIDSSLKNGYLTMAEAVLPGARSEEVLISTYCCHPSMANDNLSGLVLTVLMFNEIKKKKREYTYRFVIVPETIGAIAYLSSNEKVMRNVKCGFVVTTVGGPGKFGYKRTFLGNHEIDRMVRQTFYEYGLDYIDYPFIPDGSDERQYSSPGFRIPVSTICKDKYYEYDFYHTSLDNLDFVKGKNIVKTLELYMSAIFKLENNFIFKSLNPHCEVQLGKRGLYPETGGAINQLLDANKDLSNSTEFQLRYKDELDAILWVLFLADGKTSILDMAEKTRIPFEQILELGDKLVKENLLVKVQS